MTGKNAKYIEHRGVNDTPDNDREIVMEGDEAVYQEYAYGPAPQAKQEEKPHRGCRQGVSERGSP